MNYSVFEASGIYLQQSFEKQSESYFRQKYKLEAEEKLLAGLWLNPVLRKGFLVTEKALYWNYGSIRKDKDISSPIDFAVTCTQTDVTQIKLFYASKDYEFYVKGLNQDQCTSLMEILCSLFNNGDFPAEKYAGLTKDFFAPKIHVPLDAGMNLLHLLGDKLNLLSEKLNGKIEQFKEEASAKANDNQPEENITTEENLKSEKDEPIKEKPENKKPEKKTKASKKTEPEVSKGEKIAYGILCVLDVLASVIFLGMVTIACKPELLLSVLQKTIDSIPESENYVTEICGYLLKVNITPVLDEKVLEKLLTLRNMVMFVCVGVYSMLKLTVLCFSKNGIIKIVSLLMLFMAILSCFVLADKFLLFVLFMLLIYMSFEYSCGLKTGAVFKRLFAVIILGIITYLVLHIVLDTQIKDAFLSIVWSLKFPEVKWW